MSNDTNICSLVSIMTQFASQSTLSAEGIRSFFLSFPLCNEEQKSLEVSGAEELADTLDLPLAKICAVLFEISRDRYVTSVLWDACSLYSHELSEENEDDTFNLLLSGQNKMFDWSDRVHLSIRDFWYCAQRIARAAKPESRKLSTCFIHSSEAFKKRKLPELSQTHTK